MTGGPEDAGFGPRGHLLVRHLPGAHVGRGELAARRALCAIWGCPERQASEWPAPGVYPQVALPGLLSPAARQDLSPYHAKSSVDILAAPPAPPQARAVAVYVNGPDHDGPVRSRRDEARYRLLRANAVRVLVLPHTDCPMLFADSDDAAAVAGEVRAMMRAYQLQVPGDGGGST